MVLLKTKITNTGVLYIPKEVREAFTRELKIIPNARAALFFPADALLEDVLTSLQIIEAELKHRIQMQQRLVETSKPLSSE
ncbi:MAG: hypothetical protein ACTSPB_07295 [Candidatus Thorarchaeota archaeon]